MSMQKKQICLSYSVLRCMAEFWVDIKITVTFKRHPCNATPKIYLWSLFGAQDSWCIHLEGILGD